MENNDLSVIVKDSGLEQTKADYILEKFKDYFKIASEWEIKAKTLIVTNDDQKAEMEMARVGRLFLREKRITIEKTRKELKEQSLREGKAIDGIANILKGIIDPIERYLEGQENFTKNRLEAERQEKLKKQLEEMERKEREAEEARLKAEKEEKERMIKENEQLKKEAKEKERLRIEEQRKQQIEIEKIKAEEEKKRQIIEAQAEKERQEKERLRIEIENKQKEEAIKQQKILDEEKKKNEASDIEKIKQYVNDIKQIKIPVLDNNDLRTDLFKFIQDVKILSDKLLKI